MTLAQINPSSQVKPSPETKKRHSSRKPSRRKDYSSVFQLHLMNRTTVRGMGMRNAAHGHAKPARGLALACAGMDHDQIFFFGLGFHHRIARGLDAFHFFTVAAGGVIHLLLLDSRVSVWPRKGAGACLTGEKGMREVDLSTRTQPPPRP